MTDKIALTDLPRVLREQWGVETTYYRAWTALTDGRIPATKVGSRWHVRREKLPEIAAELSRNPRTLAAE